MDPIEQRVRESLRARAEDAEPTPHLYRGVQDRIARRRRNRMLAWVPAGAAALGVAVAVPLLLSNDPGVPDIADYADEQPAASATTPDRVVTLGDDGFELSVVDLADGSTITPYGPVPGSGALPYLEVAPSDRARVPTAIVGTPQDAPTGSLLRVSNFGRTGTSVVEYGEVTEDTVGAQFDGGLAVSADGAWTATLSGPGEDADGWALELRPTTDLTSDPMDGEVRIEPGVVVPAGSVIQDWTGSTAEGVESHVTVITPDGLLLGLPLVHEPGPEPSFAWVNEEITRPVGEREVAAYASSHLSEDPDGGPGFVLETVGDGAVVQAVAGEEILGQVDVGELIGGQDPSTFALDAWGDTAALSTPEGSWLLTHDGEGDFTEPFALPDGTVRAALVGKDSGEVPTEEPEPPVEEGIDDGDVVEEEQPEDEAASGEAGLGDGVVVADDTTVTLVHPDGSHQELMTFPAEGHSTVVDVAVRPGSTTEDLTLAITTRAEGDFDVRWLRVRDGEVDTTIDPYGTDFPAPPIEWDGEVLFSSPDLQDGAEPAAVWSPDGDLLAVVQRSIDGTSTEVRTVGWDDDGPSGPNRAGNFVLDTDRPLTARQWIWTGGEGTDRQGQLLLVDDLAREAFTVRLDRQGDGAPAMPAENPLVPVEGEGVLDLAHVDGDATIDAVLRIGSDGTEVELRDGLDGSVVGVEAAGPRDVSFMTASEQVLLVVLDPAQPMLVDRESGEVTPAPIDGEVVSADLIR